jgi:hypothetical protein
MPHDAVVSYLLFSNGEVRVQHQQEQAEPALESREPLPENTPATRETSGEHPPCRADEHGAGAGAADHLVMTIERPSSSAERVDAGVTVAVDLAATGSPSSATLHPQFCQGMGVSAVLPRRVMRHTGSAPPPRAAWGQEGDECAICLGVMAAGEYVSDLPGLNQTCNHTFHLPCAIQWLTSRVEEGKKGCCPVCNTEVVSPIFLVRNQPRAPGAFGHIPTLDADVPFWQTRHACAVSVLMLLAFGLIIYQVIQIESN